MYEIKCLIVSDGVKNVSVVTLCMCSSARSGAEGRLQLLESRLPLLLLHFLPLAFFFLLSDLRFEFAALRHCLHLETHNSSRPFRQSRSQEIPAIPSANARRMHQTANRHNSAGQLQVSMRSRLCLLVSLWSH